MTGADTVPTMIKQQAAKDSQLLLDTVWLGRGRRIPVDPIEIAHDLGIDVLEGPLDANVSAALIKRLGHDPQIVLNREDSRNRKRFSCAHELGHFYRRQDDQDQYEYVDFRDIFAASGTSDEEIYANEFGASLLMPEREVRDLHVAGWNEVRLAFHFDVSRDAMHYRKKNLGLA